MGDDTAPKKKLSDKLKEQKEKKKEKKEQHKTENATPKPELNKVVQKPQITKITNANKRYT